MSAVKLIRPYTSIVLILAFLWIGLGPARPARAAGLNIQANSLVKAQAAEAALTCNDPIRIMPLGDSITRGSSTISTNPSLMVSYRRELYKSLSAKGYQVNFVGSMNSEGSAYTDFDRDHEGHGGWRDDQIAGNIYGWLSSTPADVVLLHIGTNEVSTSASDVEDILDEIDLYENDHQTEVWVVLARIINRSCSTNDPACAEAATTTTFNNNVVSMAQSRINNDGDKILFVNMETGAGFNYNLWPGGDMEDDLHPYETGFTKIFEEWESVLKDLLPYCARDDSPSIPEDSGQTTIEPLNNDGGTDITITGWQPGTAGTVVYDSVNKTFKYTPPADFFGPDSFTYSITDGPAGSDTTATVTVNVTPVNDPPTAVQDSKTTPEDQALTFNPADNDLKGPSNESGQILEVTDFTPTANTHGSVALNAGIVTYTPEANFTGTASFGYQVCDDDPSPLCANGTVQVMVTPVNDLPSISNIADQATNEDTPTGPIAFTISDYETPAAALTLSAVSSDPAVVAPEDITFSGSGSSRSVSIQPAANKNTSSNPVTITIKVRDADHGEAAASFALTIYPVDDPPAIIDPGAQSWSAGGKVNLQIQASDPEGDALSFLAYGLPPGLSIAEETGLISGKLPVNSTGECTVEVFVSGGNKVTALSFDVQVVTGRYKVFVPQVLDQVSSGSH